MSYVVLARKWRPLVFEDVVAQSHVTTTLVNAIKNQRLASAYLFSGPRGVGKTTTARIFAKAINCDDGPTATPCNRCSSCVEITQSRSIDVFEVDGASNRGIDEVRNLRDSLKYAPSKGKYKIYIIDEVHMLTTEAFNALLKTLEEPPERVLFIFATTEPHKVPVTILSRCQRYDFRRIPLNEIVAKLRDICNNENISIDDESLHLIARKSEGSLRDSQSLLDQAVSFCGQEIHLADISDLLGVIDQEFYFQCSDCMAGRDVAGGLKIVETVFAQGYDMAEFLNGLSEHLRNILVVQATQQSELLEGLENFGERYQQAAKAFSETDLLRLIQMAAESAYQIKRSSNPRLLLEMLFVKMINMDRSVQLQELLDSLGNLPGNPGTGTPQSAPEASERPAEKQGVKTVPNQSGTVALKQIGPMITLPKPGTEKSAPEPQPVSGEPADIDPVVALNKVREKWPFIIDAVKSQKIHIGSFLNEGRPTAVDGGALEVAFGRENGFHIKAIMQHRKLIQEIVLQQTGCRLKLICKKTDAEQVEENSSGVKETVAVQGATEAEPSDDVMDIPILKKVLDVFDGELIHQERPGNP